MLTTIIANSLSAALSLKPDTAFDTIINFLNNWLKKYLPDSSVTSFIAGGAAPKREVCTYDPQSFSMWIYRGDMNGNTIVVLLILGKPMILNHLQMAALRQTVFPFSFKLYAVGKADTLAKKVFQAIATKLEEPIEASKLENHTMSVIPSLATRNKPTQLDEAMVLEQLGKFAFNLGTFQSTVDSILQIFSRSSLGKLTESFGKYRTAALPLSTPNNPHDIVFSTLYPMPSGKIFAISTKTGKILRNKVPMMLLSANTQGGKITCHILWFDRNLHSSMQPLPKTSGIFEIISP